MVTPKQEAPKPADSQATMTDFVQTFARPKPASSVPAPVEVAPEADAAPAAAPARAVEQPRTPAPAAHEEEEKPSAPGKRRAPAASNENAAWADEYLCPVRARKTKAIYVDEETHATLALLTQDAGVGLADLIINIVNNHFEAFRLEIREFLAERERLKKKASRF